MKARGGDKIRPPQHVAPIVPQQQLCTFLPIQNIVKNNIIKENFLKTFDEFFSHNLFRYIKETTDSYLHLLLHLSSLLPTF